MKGYRRLGPQMGGYSCTYTKSRRDGTIEWKELGGSRGFHMFMMSLFIDAVKGEPRKVIRYRQISR